MTDSLALPDLAATTALAARLAARLRPGMAVLLEGPLGAGKTEFARAVLRALVADPALEVPSPTFTLVQSYDTPAGPLWHFDLYRLSGPDEVLELGWDEALATAILLVEWPDRLGRRAPPGRLELTLSATGPDSREALLAGDPSWSARLEGLAP